MTIYIIYNYIMYVVGIETNPLAHWLQLAVASVPI